MESAEPSGGARAGDRDAGAHATANRAFTVFAFLWAAAALFHRAESGTWARSPVEAAESAAALLLLFRPGSGPAFLALVALQLVQNAILLPHVSNHTVFLWIMTITIATAALSLGATGRYSRARLYRSFAPALRLELLILYFFVVFHKLNPEFFDPATSCAGAISDQLVAMTGLPFDLDRLDPLAVWVTLGAEAAIPIGLALRSTRMWGIALGLAFHFVVGLANFYDFSSLLFACYFLFAPEDHVDALSAWWRRMRRRPAVAAVGRALEGPRWWRPLLLLALLLVLLATNPRVRLFWWVYGLVAIAVHLATLRLAPPDPRSTRAILRIRNPLLWIGPLLVLANGASPYIGLKTEHSFAMFSNLRTEGGQSNHYLVPADVQVLDFERDLVRIVSTNDPRLRRRVRLSGTLPYAALRTLVSEAAAAGRTGIQVRYVRGGREFDLERAELDPELSRPYPFLLRKVLLFREIVGDRGREVCLH